MINSRFGLACFALLQNRWAWALLSDAERDTIHAGNRYWNTQRPDYADPLAYHSTARHQQDALAIQRFLDRVRPVSVLEIGPGAGAATRLLVGYPTVRRYVAVDINAAFLRYDQRLIPEHLSASFIEGTIADVPVEPFDAIVLCSVVHHIPNREDLFWEMRRRLRIGGSVFATDPTHYLHRVLAILRKLRRHGDLDRRLAEVRAGHYSTHAMCSLTEYRGLLRRHGFHYARFTFDEYSRYRRWCPRPWQHYLAAHMTVEADAI